MSHFPLLSFYAGVELEARAFEDSCLSSQNFVTFGGYCLTPWLAMVTTSSDMEAMSASCKVAGGELAVLAQPAAFDVLKPMVEAFATMSGYAGVLFALWQLPGQADPAAGWHWRLPSGFDVPAHGIRCPILPSFSWTYHHSLASSQMVHRPARAQR